MYRFLRSGQLKNGKGKYAEAMMWAKEITEYIKTKYSRPIEVYVQLLGNIATIYWIDEYKDLATFEGVMGQMMSDEAYWAVVNKGIELFIDGSWNDTLMRSI